MYSDDEYGAYPPQYGYSSRSGYYHHEYSDDDDYGYTGYRGGCSDDDSYGYGYADSDSGSSIETTGMLITHPKHADAEENDHHESGSYVFNGIVLKWQIEDIRQDRLRLLKRKDALPIGYEEFSKNAMEEYYENFKPFVLDDAKATIAAGLEAYDKKSAPKYRFDLSRNVQISKNPDNPCKMEINQDLLEEVEGKSRVAVLLTPAKQRHGIQILGLASQHGFGGREKKTIIKFIADENTRYTCNKLFVAGTQWNAFILGSILSHERIYEACCLQPELAFLPQVICGKIPALPQVRQDHPSELNPSQFKAVAGFAAAENGLYLLQGPPGTGKTSTVVDLIGKLSTQKKRILICAPSNKAVQVIADRFYQKYGRHKLPIVLAGVESKLPDSLTPIFLHTWGLRLMRLVQEIKSLFPKPEGYITLSKNKGSTQIKVSFPQKFKLFLEKKAALSDMLDTYKIHQFKQALNDAIRHSEQYARQLSNEEDAFWRDVSQTLGKEPTEPGNKHRYLNQLQEYAHSAWTALIAAVKSAKDLEDTLLENADVIFSTLSVAGRRQMRQTKKVDILIVDEAGQCVEAETLIPFILQPKKCLLVGDTKQLPATVISQAAEKLQYGRSMMYRLLEDCEQPFHMLDTQYRMHPSIRHWPSMQFYQNQIMDGENIRTRRSPFPSLTSPAHQPYAFIQTTGKESTEGTSFCNLSEVNLIANFVDFLQSQHKVNPQTQIGVISFYSGQVRLLHQKLFKKHKVRVNTVDGFQGDENDIIIISFVRSNPKNTVGFLRDFRRLNVAITRGKHAVIMFGDVNTLKADRNLKSLVTHLERQKLIFSQTQFEESLKSQSHNKPLTINAPAKAEGSKPSKSQSLAPNYKTTLCKNHATGGCKKGIKCHYAHGEDELKKYRKAKTTPSLNADATPGAPKSSMTPQKALAQKPTSKKADKASKQPEKYKTALCKQFKKGSCARGDQCHFAHGKEELIKAQKSKTQPALMPTQAKQKSTVKQPKSPSSTAKASGPAQRSANPSPLKVASGVSEPTVNKGAHATAQPQSAVSSRTTPQSQTNTGLFKATPADKAPITSSAVDPYAMLEQYRSKGAKALPTQQPKAPSDNTTPVSKNASPTSAKQPPSTLQSMLRPNKKYMRCRFFSNGNCPNGDKCEMLHIASQDKELK